MRKSIVGMYLSLLAMSTLGLAFTGGIYSNFLRSHGLSELQLNLVNVAYFLTIFVFEIPTGIYADVFGRKKSFVISCFLMATAEFTYSLSHNFWGFVTAEVMAGIAATFASGAFQSWFVDRMKHHGCNEKLTRVFAWEGIVKSAACMLAAVIGGKLADSSFAYPWIAGGIASLTTGVLAVILMKEEYFVKKSFSLKESLAEMKLTASQSWHYTKNDRAFRFILTIGFILMFSMMAPNMQWQKIFSDHYHSNYYISLVMVGVQLSIMFGGYSSGRLLSLLKGNEKLAIIICQTIIGLAVILTVLTSQLPVIIMFFLIHEVFRGAFRPIKDAYLQDMLPAKERATLVSFESMYGHLGGALGLVTSGWIATHCGIPTAWIVSGGIMLITAFVLRNHQKR